MRYRVEIVSGTGAGQHRITGRRFTVGPGWDDDITLLDLPEGTLSVSIALRGLPGDTLTVLAGETAVSIAGRIAAKGIALPLPSEGMTLTVGTSELHVAPVSLTMTLRGAGSALSARASCLPSRMRMYAFLPTWMPTLPLPGTRVWFLALACFAALTILYLTDVPMVQTTPWTIAPIERSASGPRGAAFSDPVRRAPLSAPDILARAAANGVGPGSRIILAIDPESGLALLKGLRPGTVDASRRLEAFERWYDAQPDLPPLVRRVVAVPVAKADYPDIGMVLSGAGGAAPTIVTSKGRTVRLGDTFSSGWLYRSYADDVLVFRRGSQEIEVKAGGGA